MSVIGNFSHKDGKYTGTIRTMTINVKAQLVPVENPGKGAPDYRLFAGGAELGAGWVETSQDDREYISMKLDDPSFAGPVRGAFFENKEEKTGILIWNRARKKQTGDVRETVAA